MELPAVTMAAAKVASSYGKRWADQSLWDAFMLTSLGQKLLTLSRTQKYGVEAVAYLLDTVVWHNIGDSSPLRVFMNEILGDAAPEIAKRMLNGDHAVETPSAPGRACGMEAVFRMDPDDRTRLLGWYQQADADTRRTFADVCARMNEAGLANFARITDDHKAALLNLVGRKPSQLTKRAVGAIDTAARMVSIF